jgi:hypothetical protein
MICFRPPAFSKHPFTSTSPHLSFISAAGQQYSNLAELFVKLLDVDRICASISAGTKIASEARSTASTGYLLWARDDSNHRDLTSSSRLALIPRFLSILLLIQVTVTVKSRSKHSPQSPIVAKSLHLTAVGARLT